MAFLTQKIHKKNTTRSNIFDMSNNVNTLIAPGMLLPIRTDEVIPGDVYKFSIDSFARTLQMVVPPFVRCRAHIDSFFVPLRLLGTDFPDIVVGNNRGILANYSASGSYTDNNPSLPYVKANQLLDALTARSEQPFTDASGCQGSASSVLLLNALGYGINKEQISNGYFAPLSSGSDNSVKSNSVYSLDQVTTSGNQDGSRCIAYNTLPLQAYQKIYQDYYRNKLWEKENKSSYFCPPSRTGVQWTSQRLNTLGLIEMRYHDFDKDRITGIVPDENGILSDGVSAYAQDIVSGMNFGLDSIRSLGSQSVPSSSSVIPGGTSAAKDDKVFSTEQQSNQLIGNLHASSNDADYSALVTRFNALSIRRLSAMQKFAEITDLNKSDYKHQVAAHFGVQPSDIDSDYSTYIGGADIPLQISDVENNGVDSNDDNLGYLAGKGVFYQPTTKEYTFNVGAQHGIIMHILYILPEIDYLNTYTERLNLRLNRYDFAIPEFDSFGFEPVRVLDLFNTLVCDYPKFTLPAASSNYNAYQVLGYLPRYWSYKTKLDSNNSATLIDSGATTPRNALNYDSYIISFPYQRFLNLALSGSTYAGLKVTPWCMDSIFPTSCVTFIEDDPFQKYKLLLNQMPFVFHVHFNCTVKRSLSVDGLPY